MRKTDTTKPAAPVIYNRVKGSGAKGKTGGGGGGRRQFCSLLMYEKKIRMEPTDGPLRQKIEDTRRNVKTARLRTRDMEETVLPAACQGAIETEYPMDKKSLAGRMA